MSKIRETDAKLKQMAERLRLSWVRDNVEPLVQLLSESRMTAREILSYVFEKEIEQRESNRVRISTMAAHFPKIFTLEEFDLSAQPALDPGIYRELCALQWIDTAENAIFIGPPGVGKTHLATGLGIRAISKGYAVRFFSASNLVSMLLKSKQEGLLAQKIGQLQKFKLLIIDEIGYLPFGSEAASVLFELINRRYETRSTVVTSNRPPSEWGLVLGDPTAATAILDRLLHHCIMTVIQGDSYRLRQLAKGKTK